MGNPHTNVESVAFHVVNKCGFLDLSPAVRSPFVLNGLYDETKCWADRVHVFVHQSLDDCGFAGIVQPSEEASAKLVECYTSVY